MPSYIILIVKVTRYFNLKKLDKLFSTNITEYACFIIYFNNINVINK